MQSKSSLLQLEHRTRNLSKGTWFMVIVSICVINLSCICGYHGPPVYEKVQVGKTNDIIIDRDGTIHVLYSLYAPARMGDSVFGVYYTRRSESNDWQTEIVGTWSSQPQVHALGRGPNGDLHAFYGSTQKTMYGWKKMGGEWETETFLTNGYVGDVAFDADGAMHVSHSHWLTDTVLFDNVSPDYTYKPVDGHFHSREIKITGFRDVDHGRVTDIAVDSAGKVYIVLDVYSLMLRKINYVQIAANDGVSTPPKTAASFSDTNWYPSLAIDSDDRLHMAFTGYYTTVPDEELEPKLKYTVSYDGGATWEKWVVVDESNGTGQSPEIAVDGSGGLHIAYMSPETYEVKYAYKAPEATSWSIEIVDSDVPTDADISLALDGTGNPFILYPKVSSSTLETPDTTEFLDLKLAHRTENGLWVTETIKASALGETE